MADGNVASSGAGGGGHGNGGQQGRQAGGFGSIIQTIFRMGMMWYFFKQFGNKKPADGKEVVMLNPMMSKGTPVDVHFFLTDTSSESGISGGLGGGMQPTWFQIAERDIEPLWVAKNVPVAEGEQRVFEYVYRPSKDALNNGSVLIHAVFTPAGASPNPSNDGFEAALTWGLTKPLNVYLPKKKAGDGINLLSGKNSTDGKSMPDDTVASNVTEIVSYLKPNVTVNFINEFGYVLWLLVLNRSQSSRWTWMDVWMSGRWWN